MQRGAAVGGDRSALLIGFRLLDGDSEAVVGWRSPPIRWMGFADINREKGNPICVPTMNLLKGPGPGPERPSGEAAKDQHDRT
jgi:hypothetical protein